MRFLMNPGYFAPRSCTSSVVAAAAAVLVGALPGLVAGVVAGAVRLRRRRASFSMVAMRFRNSTGVVAANAADDDALTGTPARSCCGSGGFQARQSSSFASLKNLGGSYCASKVSSFQ